MRYWRGWVCVLAIFLSGAFVGGVCTWVYMEHWIHETMAGGAPKVQSVVIARLSDRLDLSGEQEAEVRRIIEAGRDELQVIHNETRPRIETKVLEVTEEVKTVLDDEQGRELDEIVQELLERWREHQDNPPRVKI